MTTVNQNELQTAVSVDELLALGANPTLSDLLFYVRDGSQASENGKHRKVAGNTLRSLMQLNNAAGSDAAVSMVANTEYDVEGSAFNASRTYSLPGAVKGDRIRINFASAHATHALILAGATGVTINGGSAASEWSRLIIAKEWAEFRATSSTNWDVYNDGRIPQRGRLRQDTEQNITHDSATRLSFQTTVTDIGGITNLSSNRFEPRRTNQYLITVRGSFFGLPSSTRTIAYAYIGGQAVDLAVNFVSYGGDSGAYPQLVTEQSVSAGQFVEAYLQWDRSGGSGTENTIVSSTFLRPVFSIREML
jgi:hypothetical protein